MHHFSQDTSLEKENKDNLPESLKPFKGKGMGPFLLSYAPEIENEKRHDQIQVSPELSIRLNMEALQENQLKLISYAVNSDSDSDSDSEINIENNFGDVKKHILIKKDETSLKLKQEIFKSKLNKVFNNIFPIENSPVSHINLSPELLHKSVQIRLKNAQIKSVKKIIEEAYQNIQEVRVKDALIWSKIDNSVGGCDSSIGKLLHNSQELEDLLQELG